MRRGCYCWGKARVPEGQIRTILHPFLFHPLLKTTYRKNAADPLELGLEPGSLLGLPLPGLNSQSIEDLLIRRRRP